MTKNRRHVVAALCVHFYTAVGGILAFFTLLAINSGKIAESFLLLFVSTIIDYSDGTIARRIGVRTALPSIEGDKLDSIIDFVNNTLLPAYLLWLSGNLPKPIIFWSTVILLAGLMRYSTIDGPEIDKGLFSGLPTPWLFVAFYFYFGALSDVTMIAIIAICCILCFAPTPYIHIARFDRWTGLSSFLLGLWWLSYLLISQNWTNRPRLWMGVSLLFPIYYLLLPWILRQKARAS